MVVCVYDLVVYFTPPISNKDADHLSFLEIFLIVQDDFEGYYYSRSFRKKIDSQEKDFGGMGELLSSRNRVHRKSKKTY